MQWSMQMESFYPGHNIFRVHCRGKEGSYWSSTCSSWRVWYLILQLLNHWTPAMCVSTALRPCPVWRFVGSSIDYCQFDLSSLWFFVQPRICFESSRWIMFGILPSWSLWDMVEQDLAGFEIVGNVLQVLHLDYFTKLYSCYCHHSSWYWCLAINNIVIMSAVGIDYASHVWSDNEAFVDTGWRATHSHFAWRLLAVHLLLFMS